MKDENSFPKPDLKIVFVSLTLLSFLYIIITFSQNDFWQDELYAMNHFVFVPWRTIITDYHSTNNHIVFDLVLKAWTQILGLKNSCEALEAPLLLRSLPLLFTAISIIYFYSQSKNIYGKKFSLIAISILCSTMVFADFAVQLRGYSFSLLLTLIQYFSFFKLIRSDKRSVIQLFVLFLSTATNLLCIPTAIYFTTALFLLSLLIYFSKAAPLFFFNKVTSKGTAILVVLILIAAIVPVGLYYKWLLNQQPTNELVNSYNLFNAKNLLQALAVFYHFTDYRFYFFVIMGIYLFRRIRQLKSYSDTNFPLLCFFIPFILYFIHSPVIVQRIFVPLIPVFTILMAAMIEDIFSSQKNQLWVYLVLVANWLCLLFSDVRLEFGSMSANLQSRHEQDLLNHYYLIKFNASQAAIKAKHLQRENSGRLYVLDDFGETGIKYYLDCYAVKYENYTSNFKLKQRDIIITNNKLRLDEDLLGRNIEFEKKVDRMQQYQIYQVK